jgi:hypothetical protein
MCACTYAHARESIRTHANIGTHARKARSHAPKTVRPPAHPHTRAPCTRGHAPCMHAHMRVRMHMRTRTQTCATGRRTGGLRPGRYEHARRAVVRLFCDELQLAAHFAALRRYVLMHAGELMDCLSAELHQVHRTRTHTRACTRTHVVHAQAAQAAHGWQSSQALRLCLQVTHARARSRRQPRAHPHARACERAHARAADGSYVHIPTRAGTRAHTHAHKHTLTRTHARTHAPTHPRAGTRTLAIERARIFRPR